jgi:hypothetical protein
MMNMMRAPTRSRGLNVGTAVLAALAVFGAGDGVRKLAAQDRRAQDTEIFRQIATVLQHPRCMNCHTRAEYPRQGSDRHRHTMNVVRGPTDHGAPGLHCSACHQSVNQAASGVPGAQDWHLAPLRMAWEDLTVGDLCRALLDPVKGGMKADQFVPHFQTGLVRWAWSPGFDQRRQERETPPIPYEQFIALTRQWVAQGTPCPNS